MDDMMNYAQSVYDKAVDENKELASKGLEQKPLPELCHGHCDKHGDYTYIKAPFFNMDICPMCSQEETERQEEEDRKQETDRRNLLKNDEHHLQEMGIEPRYYDADWDKFIPEDKEPFHTLQVEAKDAVMKVVSDRSGSVVLLGGNGTRKTTLLSAALKNYGDGMITGVFEASFMIRNSHSETDPFTGMTIPSGFQFMMKMASTPFLVLDEMGRQSVTDFERNWISFVLRKRDDRKLPYALAGNYPFKSMVGDNYKGLFMDDILGSDVMSRLNHSYICRVSGSDFRKLEGAK